MTEATFKRIGEIIAKNPRISNYTITGYKYSGTRLVLHFVDCNQVFDFDEVDGELQVTSFYTADCKDGEYLENCQAFNELNRKDQPEG